MAKKKIGIVGGGIVGTSVAYFLSQYDEADVTLFEKNTIGSGTTAKSAGTHCLIDDSLEHEFWSVRLFGFNFYTGLEKKNPGYAIAEVIIQLKEIGAEVIGIPCNTAHAPSIFQVITTALAKRSVSVKLLNMIDETVEFIASQFPRAESIGLLATKGTYESNVYTSILHQKGYKTVVPDSTGKQIVHQAIYDKRRGIKSQSTPVSIWAAEQISASIKHLSTQGAECIILGCTELPLVLPLLKIDSKRLIDPTLILARALIRETYPQKLKPLTI